MLFAIVSIIFLSIFLLAAAVQYNDPDAALWLTVYLVAALSCALYLMQRLPRWLAPALLFATAAWALSLLPAIVGQVSVSEIVASLGMQTRAVEEAREMGGLLLIALWAALLWRRQRYLARVAPAAGALPGK